MNAKNLFESGQSFLQHFVRSSRHSSRHQKKKQSSESSPMIFIGSWKLRHSETARTHSLVIGPDLTINIDHRTIPAQVVSMAPDKLVLLDHYGYHITITADDEAPVKMFDEADDVVYYIIPAKES
ncbi:DUF4828 domain-containing protein [Secundilactobacillus folii]|nr:DUF4828 domain-containing protein [Secundilactobacillus folii]